jgi:hypothetical protein
MMEGRAVDPILAGAVTVAVSTFEAFGELRILRMNGERESRDEEGEKMDGGEFD